MGQGLITAFYKATVTLSLCNFRKIVFILRQALIGWSHNLHASTVCFIYGVIYI